MMAGEGFTVTRARLRWLLISVTCSALLAGVTAFYVTDWALHRHADHHHHENVANSEAHTSGAATVDLHAWMHAHLDLTPEQHTAMAPGEAAFEEQRARLRSEIAQTAAAVATAAASATDTRQPELAAALTRLSTAQSALQRATLEHFFAMKRYLRPAQQRKLSEWTHDSLTRH